MAENKFLKIDRDSFPYIFMKNVDIPLKTYEKGILRCNVYLPKDASPFGSMTYPVIATYGPWELDTMSRGTSEAFFDVIEWASEQEWSSSKVALLGISYYAGTQWRVAARQPKGLSAIIPWEGMSDYYRDRTSGGTTVFSQISTECPVEPLENGAMIPSKETPHPEALVSNRRDQTKDTAAHKYMDEEYYKSRNFDLSSIQVPLLSVANWTSIVLLDAFLKDNDYDGWKSGQQPRVNVCLRKGDCGVDDPERELNFPSRAESDWPIPDTQSTPDAPSPTEIDLFVTLRKLDAEGKEVFYTGTMGDPVPIAKGWLRTSLRKVNANHPFHQDILPYRDYFSSDVQPVKEGEKYGG
ncbi:uncharacterized protein N7498_009102 [Penicillium cinerascens]|uniref:Xaa-Pro dipeptidyl-peptidase-like domain-containing protein n=1 Tax=Penicillium cinerascens TaxID=70096 RepID=A0A9W9M7L8_9EURO|nr:uncharacterized protein N7498_009102 [Penicillium cinerascens]KAJ5190117.1 hypothetical protein N7498_009102 [Penicillium cinerascens]